MNFISNSPIDVIIGNVVALLIHNKNLNENDIFEILTLLKNKNMLLNEHVRLTLDIDYMENEELKTIKLKALLRQKGLLRIYKFCMDFLGRE
jgi:hypothetical protein